MSELRARLLGLIRPTVHWCDPHTGAVVETDRISLADRWVLFGPQVHTWRWVRRHGELPCGCTRNPLTRKMVLTAMMCPVHGLPYLFTADDTEETP